MSRHSPFSVIEDGSKEKATEMSEPVIVRVTFLREDEGGRMSPACLVGNRYRPALVTEDVHIRTTTPQDDAFGVLFDHGPENAFPGKEWTATVTPIFAKREERLPVGTTFTVREGARIVGFGAVTAWPILNS